LFPPKKDGGDSKTPSLPPEAAISLPCEARLYRCGEKRSNIVFADSKYIAEN
jgi:hypothetical protein